ncbi:MAG: cytochrome b/b6 domain-containing protein [Candidatus Competibacterales bacterium]
MKRTAAEGPPEADIALRPVWDPVVRGCHWALVGLLVAAWLTAQGGVHYVVWHAFIGYAWLLVLGVRLGWGWIGPSTARFGRFVRSPRAVLAYARTLPTRLPSHWYGHNPVGGWATLLLLGLALLQGLSGLFMSDDIFFDAPLYQRLGPTVQAIMPWLHRNAIDVLWLVSGLHVVAVAFYALHKGENLVGAMITGRRWVARAKARDHSPGR